MATALHPLGQSRPPQGGAVPLLTVALSQPPHHPYLPPTDGGGGEVTAQCQRAYTSHVQVSQCSGNAALTQYRTVMFSHVMGNMRQ